jgi:hypothetical protein
MNIDISYNNHHGHGRTRGVAGGDSQLERNQNSYYERFHLNQYYNAVEDEQTTMDEYTMLLHSYNNFIVNGNAMFSRMEQTLRENVTRCIVRQHFYYNQYHLRHSRGITAGPTVSSSPQMTTAAAPAPAAESQIADIFPRLLSRYLNTEIARERRHPHNNIFSMLYTVPAGARTTNVSSSDTSSSAPTNEQIRIATHDTVFGNIISPVNAICPISRDEFTDESEITMLRGCNHIFNRGSLREWFVRHSSCPLCRSDIRDYRPSSNQSTSAEAGAGAGAGASPRFPANLSIDHIDENNFTFSYDIPINYNDGQLYDNIVNTINRMNGSTRNNYPERHDDDDMNVD